jgi:hypothetical protein
MFVLGSSTSESLVVTPNPLLSVREWAEGISVCGVGIYLFFRRTGLGRCVP